MTRLLIEGNGFGLFILLMIFIAIGIPIVLFVVGLLTLRENKKKAKIILIIAAVYSIISFGICGGL
ncbi:hypothetical protein H8K90_05365 [Winogradskyella echinorum]|uniref:Uncharacterized protein n=1 Tax=Winogradskyella echinorum TaxID=538189 RepID=A0ABR6XZ72_9FLAO|nr:hypothetical protein [Winogradskyella echinorum]MBC3845797.1 hypothetical protein [Winogradskyella echinorum]MBC5750145.1 hypothetical protein [Winogradskyella echinorum]